MSYFVSFTGHRPKSLPWGYNENSIECMEFKEKLRFEIEALCKVGCKHFLTGMAMGIDMICAEIVLNLKEKYPLTL